MRLFVQDEETAPERGRDLSEVTELLLRKHFTPDLREMIPKANSPCLQCVGQDPGLASTSQQDGHSRTNR